MQRHAKTLNSTRRNYDFLRKVHVPSKMIQTVQNYCLTSFKLIFLIYIFILLCFYSFLVFMACRVSCIYFCIDFIALRNPPIKRHVFWIDLCVRRISIVS